MSINKIDIANKRGYFNFLLKIDNMLAIAINKHIIIGNFAPFLRGSKTYKYIPESQKTTLSQSTIRLILHL
jgi:hypothetical protein